MRWGYRICRLMCQVAFLLLFRGRVFGLRNPPRTGGVLLICNHQSFLDPVLATLALPRECHYMARDTLFQQPLLRKVIQYLNAFPIKRNSADIGAVKESLQRLKRGNALVVFPEGTRTCDGAIQPLEPGAILIARKAGAVLVPTVIVGAFECWPRISPLPLPGRVVVAYGEPIAPDGLAHLSPEAAAAHVRELLNQLLQRYRDADNVRGRLRPLPTAPERSPGNCT